MHCAAYNGHGQCISELSRLGFNKAVSLNGFTPLLSAVWFDQLETVDYIIEELGVNRKVRCNNGNTTLMIAARNGSQKCLEYFLSTGFEIEPHCNIDQMTPVHYAAIANSVECLELLHAHEFPLEPVNIDEKTPLQLAAALGCNFTLTWLINHGCDPRRSDSNGETALLLAQINKRDECIKILTPYYD